MYHLLLLYTTTDHFSIGLWRTTKSGFYMTSDDQLSGWTEKKLQSTSQSQTWTKNGHGHCLLVCYLSDPLQLSESQQNHYLWEEYSINQWNSPKTAMPVPALVNRKGPVLLHDNTWPQVTQRMLQKLNELGYKVCIICHSHLTSCQLTSTSSSISTTFCRENASTSRRQKMLSKSSLNPEAQIFMLQE